ncbi:hypothetical protein [Sinomonas gamaensis]|uniref:hypothetical protein n=1 Tax=Sinomonas gamaensis TaxID=2565624 RepID=UPI00110A01EA|nr:hypothetical protein [Sinomonas gamaensis]
MSGPPVLRRPEEDADAAAARRRRARRGVQNANIALYAASLLIVAAGSLFLASGVADIARIMALICATALFYSAGLVVHARVPRLRPAAVAFTGTGLALLPVSGLAVDLILVHRPGVTWLVTSLVGLVAFGAAAVRLQSRILVYLSLTFAFSAAWSGASALGGALAMDFAAIIMLSVTLGIIAVVRPRWVPPIILRSVIRLHPYVAPATFAAATFAAPGLERGQYPALVGALCLHFSLTVLIRGPLALRRFSWWSARTTAVIAVATAFSQAADLGVFGDRLIAFDAAAVAAGVMTALQVLAVGIFERPISTAVGLSPRGIRIEQGTGTVILAALLLLAVIARALDLGGARPVLFVLAALTVLGAQFCAWRHGRATEALPVVALALIAVVGGPLGRDSVAVLSLVATLYWLARAIWSPSLVLPGDVAQAGWDRGRCVVAARIASVFAASAVLNAVLPGSVGSGVRAAAVATAAALMASLQLVVPALRQADALRPAPFAGPHVTGFMAAAAVGGTVAAALVEPPHAATLHVIAALGCSIAALTLMTMSIGKPHGESKTVLTVRFEEWLPAAMLSAAGLGLFAADRWGGGTSVLATLCVVCAGGFWQSSNSARRWMYGWATRVVVTALALAVFHMAAREGWVLTVVGQTVTAAHVLGVVALAQLAIPLVAEVRGTRRRGVAFRWGLEDASVILAVATAACATASGPVTSALIVGVAVGAALAGLAFLRRKAAVAVAPSAYILTSLLAAGDLRVLEIVTAIFAVYAAIVVFLSRDRTVGGVHLVAARLLPLVLVAMVAHDATASGTVVSVALAAGLAAQHVARLLLRGRAADLPFQAATYWSSIAAQFALPVVYAATGRGEQVGGRWVLLVESLLLVASVLLTLRRQRAAGYAGIVGLLMTLVWAGPAIPFPRGQFLAQPLVTGVGMALTACVIALAHTVGMVLWDGTRRTSGNLGSLWPWTAGAASFAFVAATASAREPAWVVGLALASCAAVLFAASSVWGHVPVASAVSFPLGTLAAPAATIAVAQSIFAREVPPWDGVLVTLVGGVLPAGIGLALRWATVWAAADERLVGLARLGADPVRRWSLVGSAVVALGLAARAAWAPPASPVLPFLALALVALTVPELAPRWRRIAAELGTVLVVAAIQRALFAGRTGESPFWLAQWYVVVAAVVAGVRYFSSQVRAGAIWLAAAASMATVAGLAVAFSADGPQQVWLLVVFAGLVGTGVVVGERRFSVWGALGVLACVLWAVRAYPYLLLGALGLALIGCAVWWLVRSPRGTLLP